MPGVDEGLPAHRAVNTISSRRRLRERIRPGEVVLADGALGSLLLEMGVPPGRPPEETVLTRAELVFSVAKAYAEAGAELIQAATFGASRLSLERYGLADRTAEINRSAVEIARRAAGDRAYVWASLGPTGRMLRPYGEMLPEQARDAYVEQAELLCAAGVDLVAVETMTDLQEALLAVRAVRSVSSEVLLAAAMTFERRQRGFFTLMGNTITEAASALADAGADMVGSNCGNGIEVMTTIGFEFRRCTQLPLLLRPNAGVPVLVSGRVVYPESPQFMAERLPELLACEPAIVGGCCGTTPDHIREFYRVLRSRRGNAG